MGLASSYTYYRRQEYFAKVREIYAMMKREIKMFPELGDADSDDVVKNFGNTRWNDPDFESED